MSDVFIYPQAVCIAGVDEVGLLTQKREGNLSGGGE